MNICFSISSTIEVLVCRITALVEEGARRAKMTPGALAGSYDNGNGSSRKFLLANFIDSYKIFLKRSPNGV